MISRKNRPERGDHNQPEKNEACMANPEEAPGKKPPRPSQCRNFTRKAVAKSLPTILDTFVEQAEGGSVSHFNQLAKFGGFDLRPVPPSVKRKGKSSVRRLLDNMMEHEAKMIAANKERIAAESDGK